VAANLPALFWRPALAAGLMGLAMWAAALVHPVLAGLVALPVYAAALVLLGAFGETERALVRRVLRRA
jgi:hypothetical protein